MNTWDSETLKKINESVDIIEYASQTMELTKKGKEYFTHCPLHQDKTPSLSFTEGTNAYYCFSCGCSGYLINFLMDFEKLSFGESVEKASRLANMDLSKICKSETVQFLKSLRATHNKKIIPYQHKILDNSEFSKYEKGEIAEWLEEGISQKTIDEFDIRIDPIANRIVYAVRDLNRNLINVKGRTRRKQFKALGIAKYMNYNPVGCVDYFQGLDKTLTFVKEMNEVIIYESIKSVMKCWDWGYKNCCSAEKHHLTPEQIGLLAKLRVNVVLAFDSDVDYFEEKSLKNTIDKLKKITNVYIIQDRKKLLGGAEAKNSPADCGREVFEILYKNKIKII